MNAYIFHLEVNALAKKKAAQNEPPPIDRRQDIEIISKYF